MLFAVTIFLSAFLLFQVQPIMGRYVLPWFGGTPAVWSVCLLFFQGVLLAGYGYAHLLGKLNSTRAQAFIHMGLLAVSIALLPIAPNPEIWKPRDSSDPQGRILLLLLASVGGPYFLLSSTTPLLQRWRSRSTGGGGWRLYALSNFGSFLALLSYPFFVEPFATLRAQTWGWSAAYVVFVGACAFAAWGAKESGVSRQESVAGERLSPPMILFWLALAATASTLLLATTNLITQDIAVAPFLWILPLSIYLLSFILTFESDRWYWRLPYAVLCGVLAPMGAMATGAGALFPLWVEAAVYVLALFAVCMVCHGELAKSRPAAEHLTAFYLTVSAGGVLGGVFVALIAPSVFREFTEYPLALTAACVFGMVGWLRTGAWAEWRKENFGVRIPMMALLFGGLGALSLALVAGTGHKPLDVVRNFFGILWVREDTGPVGTYRQLTHGRIKHGSQFLFEPLKSQPTSYFGPHGGLGVVMKAMQSERPQMKVGIVGLGAGTIAAWGREGDSYRFYEINPDDERVARQWFTYLKDSKANPDVAVGDARIVLERELSDGSRGDYDMIVVDAFSSDAIPMHLLTRESAEIYRDRLKPGGVLMMHISNRTLNLEAVVRGLAGHLGWTASNFVSSGFEPAGEDGSHWILMTADGEFTERTNLKRLVSGWTKDSPLLWTDDFASLWHVVQW